MQQELVRKIESDIAEGKIIIARGNPKECVKYIKNMCTIYSSVFKGLSGAYNLKSYTHNDSENIWIDEATTFIEKLDVLKLQLLIDNNSGNNDKIKDKNISIVNNNNSYASSSNRITNEVSINNIIEKTKNDIESELGGFLSEDNLREVMEKLDDLKLIGESDESRNKKWEKAKSTFNWLSTQGVDIFTKVAPILITILSSNPTT